MNELELTILNVSLTFMVLMFIPCIYRIIVGPSIPDRLIASDALTTVLIAIFGVYGYLKGSDFFLDAALVLAIISFVGTVAIARYLDEGVIL